MFRDNSEGGGGGFGGELKRVLSSLGIGGEKKPAVELYEEPEVETQSSGDKGNGNGKGRRPDAAVAAPTEPEPEDEFKKLLEQKRK